MALERLLVVSPLFFVNAPQPSRFRELVRRWSGRFSVTVAAFDTGGSATARAEGVEMSLMRFSPAGRMLIGSRLKNREREHREIQKGGDPGSGGRPDPGGSYRSSASGSPVSSASGSMSKSASESSGRSASKSVVRSDDGFLGRSFKGLGRRIHINRFFFPDIFLVEYRNIRRHVLSLSERLQPDVVIISVAPFTLMFLAGAIRKRYPQTKVVIDAGDPFYGDSSSYSRRLTHRLFARSVERAGLAKADMIIVPTVIMKNYYLSCYGDVTDDRTIRVVENGISELFMGIPDAKAGRSVPFRMVYAGRFYRKMRDPSELYRAVGEFADGEILLKVFGNIQEKYLPPASDAKYITGGAINAEALAREYEEADLVVYLDNAYGVQVPGKVYEVLAVNRPVLYICRDERSPSFEIMNGMDGVITATNDHRSIADGIARVMKEGAGRSYRRGSERYTFDSLAYSYEKLLEKLTSRT